ncbi:MAG: acyltransferase [Ginsengibacter sp.]
MLTGNQLHKNYIPELDGLRGIAILLVITFHYFSDKLSVFSIGWTGVDLFFVLSGYLITSRLILTFSRPGYFRHFYKNRILRIFPLYYVTLIGFYFITPHFIPPYYYKNLEFYRNHAPSFFLFFENWIFIKHPDIIQNHLQVLWSLAVEEQFYLIWPFFIFFFVNSKHLKTILIIWVFLIVILRTTLYLVYPDNLYVFFYNTFCRMDAFIIGAVLFLIHKKILKPVHPCIVAIAVLSAFAGIIIWKTNPATSPFIPTIGLTCIAIFYALIIQIAVQKKYKSFSYILNRPWLIFIGRISYGLYIFHWIILRFSFEPLSNYIDIHFSTGRLLSNYLTLFLCLILSFVVSIISYRYYESFFLKLKRKRFHI